MLNVCKLYLNNTSFILRVKRAEFSNLNRKTFYVCCILVFSKKSFSLQTEPKYSPLCWNCGKAQPLAICLLFFKKQNSLVWTFLFIYLCLCWVFVAVWRVGAALWCGVWASYCSGFFCCGAWVLRHTGFSSYSTWAQ